MAVFYAFFSYAHDDAKDSDRKLFDAFSKELERRASAQFVNDEVKIWRDIENLRVGDNWDKEIKERVLASHLLIVMLSPNWLGSDYCRKEYQTFLAVEKRLGSDRLVIPLLVRNVEKEEPRLTAAQRKIFESVIARQFKPALVKEFLRLGRKQLSALVERLAEDIATTLAPLRVTPIPPTASASRARMKAAARTRSAARTKTLPPHNLPLQSIGDLFMGRDAMMDTIASDLAEKPVLALHGMGGVGKTRLAVEFAWRRAQDYTAALFISAETPTVLDAGLAGLATTLNLAEKDSPQDPPKIAAVLDWLVRTPGWLLILDNVDDEKAASAVVALLPKLTAGRTLITARYDKFPASVAKRPVGVLAPEPARNFLLARTKDARRTGADDSARAAEIAEALGHLALGLEQAGAFICAQKISFERYLAYWRDERARVVDWFDKTAIGTNHDYGLAAVWATSVARLSANGRRLFERLAFLAPEPIPEFLLDVAAPSLRAEGDDGENRLDANAPFDAREALAELYAYSLAAPAEVEGRYRQDAFSVHRLVQEFGLRSMSEARRSEMLRETLGWVNAAFAGDAFDMRNWPRLDPLVVHAISVTAIADKAGIAEPTARMMNQVGLMLKTQARFDAAEPLYRRALEIGEKNLGPDHPTVAIRLNNLAGLLKDTNRPAEAEPLFCRALAIDEKTLGRIIPMWRSASTTSPHCSTPQTASTRPSRSIAA